MRWGVAAVARDGPGRPCRTVGRKSGWKCAMDGRCWRCLVEVGRHVCFGLGGGSKWAVGGSCSTQCVALYLKSRRRARVVRLSRSSIQGGTTGIGGEWGDGRRVRVGMRKNAIERDVM
jgi:hypothetical protein